MPSIKLKHVVSFSSEDIAHPTSNLLKPENYRKWRCAEPGEKQAVVVLEFEKATKIHSIDIGNNGSALIEVLVGRRLSDLSEDFKVLLVTSSFMSPSEGKSFTNTNRVRMFGPDKLSKPVADEKWDRVKVVCTQPFNKYERYGLSFVSLHSPPEDPLKENKEAIPTSKRLGSFTLKEEEEDTITPGSLFLKKKMTSPPAVSTAALVRDASSSSSSGKTSVGDAFKSRQPVAGKPKEEKKPIPVKQDSKPVKPEKPAKPATPVAEASTKRKHNITLVDKSSKFTSASRSSPPPKKKKTSNPHSANVPIHQILKGVVFVLSGFKNPKRGDLRDKALEMGAQYKPDWTPGCTHLICAFSNTPKYNQVKGKGKIVTEKWINECYRKKRRLPSRNFHLPGDTSSSEESTEEEEEIETKKPSTSQKTQPSPPPPKDEEVKSDKVPKSSPSKESRSASPVAAKNPQKGGPSIPEKKKIVYDESTDEEMEKEDPISTKEESASDQDTEDELEKIHETDKKEKDIDDNDDDIYNKSTEDEEEEEVVHSGPDSGSEGLPELPDFLSNKHFLLYGEMDQPTRRSLIRYITAYNGILEDYMSDAVEFVLTDEKWDQNFEDALSENASLAFVRPKWIFTCHEKEKLVPFQPYIITPS